MSIVTCSQKIFEKVTLSNKVLPLDILSLLMLYYSATCIMNAKW
jgi:hypothetical protein